MNIQNRCFRRFLIATNRVWTDKSSKKQEEVEFHNVVAWGKTADIASQYVVKGSLIGVEGSLKTRTWQDKQNVSHKTTEIQCERLQLGPRPENRTTPAKAATAQTEPANPEFPPPAIDVPEDVTPEDLPF